LEGLIVWPSLGATTRIEGTISRNTLTFVEKDCVKGNCIRIIRGGSYTAQLNSARNSLSGTAVFKPRGLRGSFKLKKTITSK
ncbi:MAG: hypothetical protein KDD44_11175, partial [Bdellovibrionales bacterium]|nr:hypothetical protein [Bdellovibrionales bacterium]